MESDDDSTGSLPDQYARDNHLTIDSQIDPFFLVSQINGSIPQPTSDVGSSGLTSDAALPRLRLPTAGPQEQLEVPKESIDLLARALQHDDTNSDGQYQMPLAQYDARKHLTKLKIDPPALSSDTGYDCYELARAIRKQRQPNLRRETIPLERQNVNNDEGLVFSDSDHQHSQKLGQKVYHEKIDVTKEAMNHLVHALHNDWPDSENYKFLEEAKLRRTLRRNLTVTPPLSPYMEHEEPFIPDVDACDVPVASDLSLILSDELKVAESAALRNEHESEATPIVDADTPWSSLSLDPPGLVIGLPKIRSIRMESPLSPITSPFTHPSEGVNIPTILKSIDIDHVLSDSGSPGVSDLQIDGKKDTLDVKLKTVMEDSAAAVMRNIEQEHISIAEAISRVEVPVLDFSIPDPEWHILPMDTRVHLKWLCKSYSIKTPRPRHSRADSKLCWLPFPKIIDRKALTKETIDYSSDLLQSINFPDPKEVPTSVDYVWKRPGLAILRELESEECLEEIMLPVNVTPDLTGLARKRRLEMNAVEVGRNFSPESDSSIDLVAPSLHKRRTNLLPSLESNSAVSTLLSNYIDIHTSKRRKQDKSSYFRSTPKAEVRLQPLSIREPSRLAGNNLGLSKPAERPEKKVGLQAPCPRDALNAPTKLIKGLTLSRKLFFGLEQYYPNAEIIERDFDRWNTIAWGQYSVSTSTLVSFLAAEADVIVSPATGIIATTLLEVIQKPPPGHRGQSLIRERISRIALRYERLVVLVSEANAVDETVRDLTPQETIAYAEFIGFATALDSKVNVFYVGGGEATLLQWLCSFVARHTPEATQIQEHIIQDETQWELFLRCAGFNAYAAQAVLCRLKLGDHTAVGESECSKPGLVTFITMTDVERLQRFRDLMGGESVLNRVNKTLATKWR
ncbi:hypothetical protein F4803DRAFT_502346 [Xylaria telfairii]|nr:hypothetical protein F4803DRAFT_502346 [Xylaria telfairii]